ncbi:hypothetical protein MNEG_12077 [Monoraphidium neglectum]|uniref:Pre-mRNA-processing factor 6 n=1 Tax=Monoraphidium neglectum TaxID=145388 RepID=A0A0D2LWM3_9CHLO|nr:hypothetical protein MNEG_12077 [Monoraphidium neglectum]KIY95884.1 hypothetical protein MNEG_12077 [Monoraphidium neglectum]|eukprot:XP_013894904.1 hypothetical protein MNEG_12077 [Monoraphidium neglectum]
MLELALAGGRVAEPPRALPAPPPPPPRQEKGAPGGGGGASDDDDEESPASLALWDATPAACAACPALWRLHIAWELSQGRAEAARKLLLRGAHECPGAKALWLGGLRALCGGMAARELSGLMGAMQERLMLRTEVLEVMLAALDSEGIAHEVAAAGAPEM